MDLNHASQIAELLNARNQLVTGYTSAKVMEKADSFLYELKGDIVIACVEAKKVQWYQWEICHLTVAADCEGQGLGSRMIKRAEQKAKNHNARIIQCTIRSNNTDSERAFIRNGFQKTAVFYYPNSGNDVSVWQKVVSHRATLTDGR